MGSKRYLLNNGLGELISSQLPEAKRFADPFCGSCSVIKFVLERFDGAILAGDLQQYAVILAKAMIERTKSADPERLERQWILQANNRFRKSSLYRESMRVETKHPRSMRKLVLESRKLCTRSSRVGPLWNAYGGHYFSPRQALAFDYLLQYLPERKADRNICLAAIIISATRCSASPGHTAQPFQPTETASKYIKVAWNSDPFRSCAKALREVTPLHTVSRGAAVISGANEFVSRLGKGDLVIIDPPYSGVQYSRFYHVLETIARGRCGDVSGVGRYPSIPERPQSAFSNVSQSLGAFEELMMNLAIRQTNVIVTFPKGKCSNGLSGDDVMRVSRKWFSIDRKSRTHEHVVSGKFSTLGGNNKLNRNNLVKRSRVISEELLLLLRPRNL